MHLYKKNKKIPFKGIVLSTIIFIIAFFSFSKGFNSISNDVKQKEIELLERAINNAVVNCYAAEGYYPSDLDYIKQVYGVVVDEDKFFVNYEVLGANIRPYINIIYKQ